MMGGTVQVLNFIITVVSWTVIHPPWSPIWTTGTAYGYEGISWFEMLRVAFIHTAPLLYSTANIFMAVGLYHPCC